VEQLRGEIDDLIAETQNPTTSLQPQRSLVVLNNAALRNLSRPSSRSQSMSRSMSQTPRQGRSRQGSRRRSRALSLATSSHARNSMAPAVEESSGTSTPVRERTVVFSTQIHPANNDDIV